MGGRGTKIEKELLKSLSAGLSQEEIERVLVGALSTLGAKGIERLSESLGPDTGAALRRALRSRGKKRPPVPGPSKVIQEWERAWGDWEWRRTQRGGKSAFDLIDKLRSLEASRKGLGLDDKAVASFVRGLGREAKEDMLEGIRRKRGEDRWKKPLDSAHSGWFRLYQDLWRAVRAKGLPVPERRKPR